MNGDVEKVKKKLTAILFLLAEMFMRIHLVRVNKLENEGGNSWRESEIDLS